MLVDVRDPSEVASAMQKLAGDPGLRKSLADAAFEHAWNNFRADVVVPQYESSTRDSMAGGRKETTSEPYGQASMILLLGIAVVRCWCFTFLLFPGVSF